jgi:hypothetical protein
MDELPPRRSMQVGCQGNAHLAQVPAGRAQSWRVVFHPCSRCRRGDCGGDRPRTRGVCNVVDDDPASVGEWLPAMAREVGARTPAHVPKLIGRLLAAGGAGVHMITEIRGAIQYGGRARARLAAAHPSLRGRLARTTRRGGSPLLRRSGAGRSRRAQGSARPRRATHR